MPQLNPEWFASQIFWLIITFVVLYYLMSRIALPRIRAVIDDRERRINEGLAEAERLRDEARAAQEGQEQALHDARARAQQIVADAQAEVQAESDRRHKELNERLEKELNEAEARIDRAKQDAMEGVQGMAVELVGLAADRVAGVSVDEETATQAVKGVMEQEKG